MSKMESGQRLTRSKFFFFYSLLNTKNTLAKSEICIEFQKVTSSRSHKTSAFTSTQYCMKFQGGFPICVNTRETRQETFTKG